METKNEVRAGKAREMKYALIELLAEELREDEYHVSRVNALRDAISRIDTYIALLLKEE